MDASLRPVQHDSVVHCVAERRCSAHRGVVIPNTLFCHSERSEESKAWMLHFAPFSMTVHLQDTGAQSVQCVSFSAHAFT